MIQIERKKKFISNKFNNTKIRERERGGGGERERSTCKAATYMNQSSGDANKRRGDIDEEEKIERNEADKTEL